MISREILEHIYVFFPRLGPGRDIAMGQVCYQGWSCGLIHPELRRPWFERRVDRRGKVRGIISRCLDDHSFGLAARHLEPDEGGARTLPAGNRRVPGGPERATPLLLAQLIE